MYFVKTLGALALASTVVSQNVTYCASGGVCYAVNVPTSTASSGSGDIFFQMSGPSTMSWIGLGQGSSMKGSNIFMMYANAAGTNVTISSRLGVGDTDPKTGNTASLTLLGGSGISNGVMTANVRCSNCNSWSGGSMSFTDSSSKWIWGYKKGSAVSSDSLTVNLAEHSSYGETTFNLQRAAGGSTSNPFLTSAAAASSSGSGSGGSSSSSTGESEDEEGETGNGGSRPVYFEKVVMAHAIIAAVAFVLLYPMGAMAIRILSFRNLLWFHAGWMVLTYMIVLASMGMGIWIAVLSDKLDAYHSIIGLAVVGALLLQPVTGMVHHLLYKKLGRPNAATYPHVWWGRAVITLGIINGGLGLQLSDNTKNGTIAYVVVAAFMWCLWMVVIMLAFLRSRNKPAPQRETSERIFKVDRENSSSERMTRLDSGPHSPAVRASSSNEMFEPVPHSRRYQ